MSLRFHEIAEKNHRILNPFSEEKLMLVGDICRLQPGMSQLDLCCGKAEMLCQWSKRWGIQGIGVDISSVFLEAARRRAHEFNVEDRISLVEGDAAAYDAGDQRFDIVSCIGATWIGSGLVGTLKMMQKSLKPDGLCLVGEPYWRMPVPDAVNVSSEVDRDDFSSLIGTLDRIESAGFTLVEMVLANEDTWDRYMASQWLTVDDWLRENPTDPDARELSAWNDRNRRVYLESERAYLGWGVFVLRAK